MTRARKWVLGIVLVGVAAALTTYVTHAVTSGVDAVRGAVVGSSPPVGITVGRMVHADRNAKFGSAHWIFTRPISSLEYPRTGDLNTIEAWDVWAHQHGGIDATATAVEVVIEGTTEYPVVLTGLTVEVIHRESPPEGVHVVPFGGGPVGKRFFGVNLDANPPTVASIPAEFEDQPAIDFPYTVSLTDPEVFLIVARTEKCDCTWRAQLRWTYHGKSGVNAIDDGGQPFRTASPTKSILYYAQDGRFKRG